VLIYWNECYFIEHMAADSGGNRLIQVPHPCKNESSGIMDLACFLIVDQLA
jgi:hypothetical protein